MSANHEVRNEHVDHYYRNAREENCTLKMSPFFRDLASHEYVSAQIYEGDFPNGGISYETLAQVNNNLSSSKCWSDIRDWEESVEYTVAHPEGDITVSDTKTLNNASMGRRTVDLQWNGTCYPDTRTRLYVSRRKNVVLENNMLVDNMRFSFMRIKNTKTFFYRTPRSSWRYKLCVVWEGETKAVAEKSNRRYELYVETNDSETARVDPKYATASFFEKILDVVSISGRRQVVRMHN